mgnify:CR=1 FL=1
MNATDQVIRQLNLTATIELTIDGTNALVGKALAQKFGTAFKITDAGVPTADRVHTRLDADGNIVLDTTQNFWTNKQYFKAPVFFYNTALTFYVQLKREPTADRDITLPDATGTVMLTNTTVANLSIGILPDARMPDLTGDVTTVEGAVATTIANAAVTLAKMADLADARLLGRSAGSSGTPMAISTSTGLSLADGVLKVADANSARVYNNANQTITTATVTALTFNSESYDNGALHSTSINTSRLTAAVAGRYLVHGFVWFNSNTTGQRQARLHKNGTVVTHAIVPGSAVAIVIHVSDILDLTANDYMELCVYQDSGGNLDVVGADAQTNFAMIRIG